MGQASENKNYFNFSKGLVTESSELGSIENSVIEIDNFILNNDGSIEKRKGMLQGNNETLPIAEGDAITTYVWANAGNDPDKTILVVQVADKLYFYAMEQATLTGYIYTNTHNLFSLRIAGFATDIYATTPLSFTTIQGRLVITGKYHYSHYVTFVSGNLSTSTFTGTQYQVAIRDLKGSSEDVPVGERPLALSTAHAYDLRNQGWPTFPTDLVSSFKTGSTNAWYPSNADIFYLGYYINSSGVRIYDATHQEKQEPGNTPAPKGKFVFPSILNRGPHTTQETIIRVDTYDTFGDAYIYITLSGPHELSSGDLVTISGDSHTYSYDDGAGVQTGRAGSLNCVDAPAWQAYGSTVLLRLTDLTTPLSNPVDPTNPVYGTKGLLRVTFLTHPAPKIESFNFEKVANYNGRIWYGGLSSSEFSSHILYSQLVTDSAVAKIGLCHQEEDPTTENSIGLLATDGGTIHIADMHKLVALVQLGKYLMVFASNGIWAVGGSDNGVFSATSQSIYKVADRGIESSDSIVSTGDSLMFFSGSAIFALAIDPADGAPRYVNVSDPVIRTALLDIPVSVRPYIKGIYDVVGETVRWLYSVTEDTTYKYNKEVVYSIGHKAFVQNTYEANSINYIVGAISIPKNRTLAGHVGYLSQLASGFSAWTTLENTDYVDWLGTAYTATMTTAHEINGDGQRKKQAPYITTHFKRTETNFTVDAAGDMQLSPASSCTMQARWDWASGTITGKVGTAQQVYRFTRIYQP